MKVRISNGTNILKVGFWMYVNCVLNLLGRRTRGRPSTSEISWVKSGEKKKKTKNWKRIQANESENFAVYRTRIAVFSFKNSTKLKETIIELETKWWLSALNPSFFLLKKKTKKKQKWNLSLMIQADKSSVNIYNWNHKLKLVNQDISGIRKHLLVELLVAIYEEVDHKMSK